MQVSRGKFIVIEGIDGSGKGTQTKLLSARLQDNGHLIRSVSFPTYGHASAFLVENYLKHYYGHAPDMDPRRSSVLYAVDRFHQSVEMRDWLDEGNHLIADRYIGSNMGHQGGKIADVSKRERFIEWLHELEYEIMGIPRPDLNILLMLPADVAQKRVEQKAARAYLGGKKGAKDGHEADIDHLRNAHATYQWMAKRFPQDFHVVNCVEGGRELTEDEVHDRVWEKARAVLV